VAGSTPRTSGWQDLKNASERVQTWCTRVLGGGELQKIPSSHVSRRRETYRELTPKETAEHPSWGGG